ncbi:STAS/SEC14 domain-containing protein [Pseudosulfitobacter sp. DSM 107133]|uniref:STAS/SEC14 domain-containing protein n=1 Tax=Pseudosulfitobacter sp. DSM 107133 TaxID=2883100 RepID=UPI000DF2EBAD|nr:STAS/SEC14 domain-containing protein [Pseudosulfitobacter sp. DSM 107133]UOA28789.1 hypothetical protein DSM107133_03547 [Pseudosulfitobacter sp. DSM 107133]
MLKLPSLIQIATNRADLYVFRITGEVSAGDMTALAAYLNDVFDQPGKVDLMLIFDRYDGTVATGALGWETLKSRLRAVSNINKYVVVGTPEHTSELVEAMHSILPVDAEPFDAEISAWRYLNAKAVAA